MRRGVWITALAAILIAVTAGGYALRRSQRHAAEIRAKRQAADAVLTRERNRVATVGRLDVEIQRAYGRFANDYTAASKAGTRRHDGVIAGTLDASQALAVAKQEQTAVERMSSGVQHLASADLAASDFFEAIYGADAVRAYRGHVQQLLTAREVAVSQWSRAIGDVVDGYQQEVNGQYADFGSNIEQYYQQSAEGITRSVATMQEAAREESALGSRLEQDLKKAQQDARATAALR